LWKRPAGVAEVLAKATKNIRMVLATPHLAEVKGFAMQRLLIHTVDTSRLSNASWSRTTLAVGNIEGDGP
jgi:hypothetical protein